MRTAIFLLIVPVAGAQDLGEFTKLMSRIAHLASLAFPSETEREQLQQLTATATADFPFEPEALYWQGILLEREGKHAEAAEVWVRGLEIQSKLGRPNEPEWARISHRLGMSKLAAGDWRAGEQLAERCVSLNPAFAPGYQLLWDAALRTGQVAAALARLKEAHSRFTDRDPSFAQMYLQAQSELGSWTEINDLVEARLAADAVDPLGHHFQARRLETEGNAAAALLHHFVAAQNGVANASPTKGSQNALQRFDERDPTLGERTRKYVAALRLFDVVAGSFDWRETTDSARSLLRASEGLAADDPIAELFVSHLLAVAHASLNRPGDAEQHWTALSRRWPTYVPALCGLAAIRETAGKNEEAQQLYQKARQIRPLNLYVWQVDRLGGTFQLTADGVKAAAIKPESPLGRFGLRPGDTILQLDSFQLADMFPLQRLRFMRLFQGGDISLRAADGQMQQRTMPIVLFEF